jgi:hypothetical protein
VAAEVEIEIPTVDAPTGAFRPHPAARRKRARVERVWVGVTAMRNV